MSVTIYTTPTCQYCQMAKEFFKESAIAYTEVDVSTDEQKAQEMIDASGQLGVPVIIVSDDNSSTGKQEVIVGFDRDRLSEILT